jgi:phage gpG-like protein
MTLQEAVGTVAAQRIKARIRENRVKPATKKENKKGQKGTTLVESSRLLGSIRHKVMGNRVIVGTNLAYARIHHEGGSIVQKVTDRMRSFFWAKFYETGIKKWKFMALSKDGMLNINIPARPYMYLNDGDEAAISKVALDFMIKELEKRDWSR